MSVLRLVVIALCYTMDLFINIFGHLFVYQSNTLYRYDLQILRCTVRVLRVYNNTYFNNITFDFENYGFRFNYNFHSELCSN